MAFSLSRQSSILQQLAAAHAAPLLRIEFRAAVDLTDAPLLGVPPILAVLSVFCVCVCG